MVLDEITFSISACLKGSAVMNTESCYYLILTDSPVNSNYTQSNVIEGSTCDK